MLNETKPYFFISNYNSIRFAKQEQWDSRIRLKTMDNTLSYQEDGVNEKKFYQLFEKKDSVRIQFQTSYKSLRVDIRGCCNDFEASLEPFKRTNYLDKVDIRSASAMEKDGFLTIFFGTGLIYGQDLVPVDYYDLKQYVPEWMVEGKNIFVYSIGEVTIDKIVWLEEFGLYALRTTLESGITAIDQVMVKSVYNEFDYEIIEFDLGFFCLEEGKYQITVEAASPGFEQLLYKSEILYVKEYHPNTHLLIYENDKNTQIDYSFGIQHLLRLEYENTLKYTPDGENTIHKTDDNSYLLSASNYEKYDIELSPLPTGMAAKVALALSCNELFIDSRSHVAEGKPTTERLGSSNLYDVKATLVLADNEYNNRSDDFFVILCVPKTLLKNEDGYLLVADTGMLVVD